MKNKNVIRKKLENGKFTTIHNSILFDTRLTPNAFRLMTAILSDSDTHFNLSQTLYCNRLGIAKQTFFNAVANLEECGYLRKTPTGIKDLKNYTLSEYGNLKSESLKVIQPESDGQNIEIEDETTNINKCKDFIRANSKILIDNDFVFPSTQLALEKKIFDITYYQNLIKEENEIEKSLKLYYNEALSWIDNIIKPDRPKAEIEFKEWLKNEIFTNRNLNLDWVTVRSKYGKLALIKYKPKQKTDYETEMGDYLESPRD